MILLPATGRVCYGEAERLARYVTDGVLMLRGLNTDVNRDGFCYRHPHPGAQIPPRSKSRPGPESTTARWLPPIRYPRARMASVRERQVISLESAYCMGFPRIARIAKAARNGPNGRVSFRPLRPAMNKHKARTAAES